MTTVAPNQDFRKVRRDLEECTDALTQWWNFVYLEDASDDRRHTALEALIHAVATLAQDVEELATRDSAV